MVVRNLDGAILIGAECMRHNLRDLFPRNAWHELLKDEFEDESFKKLEDQYYVDYDQLFPSHHDIFRIFRLIHPKKVRVVILGQDPYPTGNKANGIAFSVNDGEKIPPSLRNIFQEAGIKFPTNGNLLQWVEQGVLLLNSALTVRQGEAGSHLEYWQPFTDAVIGAIAQYNPIFVLWGKHAQSKEPLTGRCVTLKAAHPSRYSAHKGFFGCDHFKTINALLTLSGKTVIDWSKGIE